MDFQRIAADLLGSAETLLPQWLPAGRRRGGEYVAGSLRGDEGDSLSINLRTGLWADFATGEKGGDLLSLFAAMHGLRQSEAAKQLGYANGDAGPPVAAPRKPAEPAETIEYPPDDAPTPGPHKQHGAHSALYPYRDEDGRLVGYIARYDSENGKQFCPYRWQDGAWARKAFPKPRPLYGLELLRKRPQSRVLVVEGEKCADTLRPVLTGYVIVSWAGGASSVDTADWKPLSGRAVDFWPDADVPGKQAMAKAATRLIKLGCTDLRVIDPEGQPDGWDGADAVAAGMDAKAIIAWVKRDGGRYLRSATLPSADAEPVAPQAQPSISAPAPAAPASAPPAEYAAADGDDARIGQLLSQPITQRYQALGIVESVMQSGRPPANEDTVHRLCSYFRDAFWFDTFLMRPMTTWRTGNARPVDDDVLYDLTVFFQRDLAMPKMSADRIKHGIGAYCARARRNIAQEWLHSLKWDGVERLKLMLPASFGTDDDEYHAAVGRCFMVGMASRILRPGCQMDNVMLLEGGEGNGKSSALRIIGGEWFTEASESITSKDFYQCLQGKMLVELSEMSAFDRVSVEKVKAVITNRVDTYRKSYGFLPGDYPRQCVFTCTTNRDDWNRSDTGARRFWRVRTGRIDLDWLAANRAQLFAEAAQRALEQQPYWDVPDAAQRALVNDARLADPWEALVVNYAVRMGEVRPEDVLTHALEVPIDRQDDRALQRVRAILRANGFVSSTRRQENKTIRVWRQPFTPLGNAAPAPSGIPDDDAQSDFIES